LPDALDVLLDDGIRVGVWPMLDDGAGRWANARNASAFSAFARSAADVVGARRVSEIVVDMEPAIEVVRVAMGSLRAAGQMLLEGAADRSRVAGARCTYEDLVRALAQRGLPTSVVAVPMVLLDPVPSVTGRAAGRTHWQALLGTPVDGPAWSHVNVMLYTSILEGWSGGLLDRRRAESVLATACRAALARYGKKSGVSLGAVGPGAFGDEPVYRSPAELARDVAVARACGMNDLALFDLGGVLARGPVEAWLEAFVATEAARELPADSLRGRAAFSLASSTAASIGMIAPLFRRAGLTR
jgi:hypothetical protein